MILGEFYFIGDAYYDWIFDRENIETLKVTSTNGILVLFCYLITWLLLSKILKNQKTKAIVIGLITPFFFYYSALHLWYPLNLLLYIIKISFD